MPKYRCAHCGTRYYSATRLEDVGEDRCDECGAKLEEVKPRLEEDEAGSGGPEAIEEED